MPDPETIIELMEDYDLDLDQAKEAAEVMDEYEIDDPDIAVEISEDMN